LTSDGQGWEIGSSPISVDQFDNARHGFKWSLTSPFSSSTEYYHFQADLFEQYINEQPHDAECERDALSKYITSEIYRRIIPHFLTSKFDKGPSSLFHFDLHGTNVFVNKAKVEANLDWESAAVVPIEIASSPPRCLMGNWSEIKMEKEDSENYKTFDLGYRYLTLPSRSISLLRTRTCLLT